MLRKAVFFLTFIAVTQAQAWSIMDEGSRMNLRGYELYRHIFYSEPLKTESPDVENEFMYIAHMLQGFLNGIDSNWKNEHNSQMTGYYQNLSLQESPKSAKQLCDLSKKPYGVNMLIANSANRMGFTNTGGIFNKGTCWWNSSLTRSAAYLAIYQPQLPKPNNKQAEAIVDQLIKAEKIVYIPGFPNWNSFSNHHEYMILKKLGVEQKKEGLNFGWVRGTRGSAKNNAADLRAQLERAELELRLYRAPIYVMLQEPGLSAHSWLILDIKKTETGFTLIVNDSNYYSILEWTYTFGQEHLITTEGKTFIPYIQPKERQDLFKLKAVTDKFCGTARK